MVRIKTSRILQKTYPDGKPYLTQAVTVSQFPKPDVTLWPRFSEEKYCYPVGLFEAQSYIHENTWTDKVTGKARITHETRFYGFKAIESV